MVLVDKMEIFKDLRIPLPETFESPSLTRLGKFQRGILTAALFVIPTLQAILWQREPDHFSSAFRCGIRDGGVASAVSEREDLTSQFFQDYTNKYTGVSQGMFVIFVLLNLSVVYVYMSFVSERFNSWLKLRTTKQRGKILAELKGSTAVFKAHSIQLGLRLVSAMIFVVYNCLAHSIVLPTETEYRKQWTPLPFDAISFATAVICHADQAFESSVFNIALLTFATFCGALSLTELVYTWQETSAFERISDYYFCTLLLRHNSVTESTKMLIEKELFLEKQRETIRDKKRPKVRLPLMKSSNATVCSVPCNLFISQQKLKYRGVKKQKHKQELFRTYSRTKKISVSSLEDLLKPGRDSATPKRILVTGAAGIGKTELTLQLVEEFNTEESGFYNLNFVFVFNFKELSFIDNLITLQDFLNLSAFCSRLGGVVYRQIASNPEEVLLVFDGLNEWTVTSLVQHDDCTGVNEEKMSVSSIVLKLFSGELLPGSTIIVTSRPTPLLSEIVEMVSFDRYVELGCFKPEELKTYIQEFFKHNEGLIATVRNRISSDPNLQVLCRLPENCHLLCLYLDLVASTRTPTEIQSLELPSSRTEIFERSIETATNTESDQSELKAFSSDHFTFSKNSLEVFEKLSGLAFEGIMNEMYVFRKEDLSHVELGAFEVDFLEEAGLLCRLRGNLLRQTDVYYFRCLSIQEYLAARRIVQSSSMGDLRDFLEKANENHCATLQFVAGLCKNGKAGKGIFVCLMQHLTEAIKVHSFVHEPVIDNQAIVFLCRCLFENGTKLGHPFAREATSSISSKPIVFTEIGTDPVETQAILYCLKEAITGNVKRVIFESNAMKDDGFRQVAASICEESCKLDQVNLTSSGITDNAMLSFLEISAGHSFLGIKILGLTGNDITSEGARYLACVLFNDWCHLEELHLGNNRIGDLGVEYFSEALCSGSSRIHTLDLSSNGITHNGVFHLSRALSSPVCNVTRLYLQKNKILDFGMQDLCESLCTADCNLRVLFASSNEITDDGIMFVEKALAHKSCNLQELYLGYNLVTDKGVKSLLQALPTQQINLKILSLANNPITDVGVKMLANALRNSSCNLHRLCISLGRQQVAATKASKLQVRYVNAF